MKMMQIDSVMTRGVRSITPTTTLKEAASLMASLNVGSLPVCEGSRLVGLVTDRDITVRGTATGMDPARNDVATVMSGKPHTVRTTDGVAQGIELMAQLQLRRLPVVDADGVLVGIVSLGDLAVRQRQPLGEALTKISQPEHSVSRRVA